MLDPASYSFLDITIRDHLAIAIIDHPERKNAVRPGESNELSRFLTEVGADDRVHVAVVAGIGTVFCAGGGPDAIDVYRAGNEAFDRMHRNSLELVQAHINLDKPVVTGLNGLAAGVGAAFALFADFI